MRFCVILIDRDEVVVEAQAVDNLAEFAALAKKDGFISGRMSNNEPLLIPWHAIIGVREAQKERPG